MVVLLLNLTFWAHGQSRVVRGLVIDSAAQTPIPKATVCVAGTNHCVLVDNAGNFRIGVDSGRIKIICTATGYQPFFFYAEEGVERPKTVLMKTEYASLEEVIVNARKKRYRNKHNPAVELIREVIAHKASNSPYANTFLSFREYEKTRVLMDKPTPFLLKRWPFKKFQFVFDNVDSLVVPGKKLSAVYIQEVLSDNYFRQQPRQKKKLVIGHKTVDYGAYVDMHGIHDALNRMYEDINIYDNNIDAFTTQFVSPVSDLAPGFYMFFIADTVEEAGIKLVKLDFIPRNSQDLLFQGSLYITLDGDFAVKKLRMSVNRHANINFIHNITIRQEFEKGPGEHYHLSNSEVEAFFSAFAKSNGLFAQRSILYSNLTDSNLAESVFKGLQTDTLLLAAREPAGFWEMSRPQPLDPTESSTYKNIDSLVQMKPYRHISDWMTVLTIGYKSAGKFDIGKIGNFYSFNPVEGTRFSFGGRTNPSFSDRYYLQSYGAYGLTDKKWKYYISGVYSINHKSIYSYPLHYFQVSYLNDTKYPGQENLVAQGNAFLSSFSRGYGSGLLYDHIFRLNYVQEYQNHLTYEAGFKYWKQQPSDSLHYIYEVPGSSNDTIHQLTAVEFSAGLRWAPHEQFFTNKMGRKNIVNKYPIITLQYSKGVGGFLGGRYNYDAIHLNLFKRFYLSPFGYTDIVLDAGYLAGKLPFPMLVIHPANESYFYSYYAYNLMNVEEFVSDHYAGINIDHYFNGFFFNKVPLFKKMRLREVVAAKILFGGLRDENNPAINPLQMKFPLTNGQLNTYSLNGTPYAEASVGVFNIFSILRVDLVKRFTYVKHPGISTLGLRFSFNVGF